MITLLVDTTLRSLAFAGAAGLVLWLFRVRDAGARLAAWTAVLYGLLILPFAATLLPRLNKPVISAPAIVLKMPVALTKITPQPAAAPRRMDPVASAYAAIALLLLARLGYGLALTHRLRRAARPVDDPRVLAILDELRRLAGLRGSPSIAQSDALAVPVTVGCISPAVILPATWKSWDRAKLSAVLAHELAHVRQGDYRTLLVSSIYRCLSWFNPLAWWLDRHLRELAEQASDDAALRATQDQTRYAEILLDFFEASQSWHGRINWQGVAMASGQRANRRIDRILASGRSWSNPSVRRVIFAIALVASPLLYLSAVLQPTAIAQTSQKHDDKVESYVIISGDATMMSASIEDFQRARSFRAKLGDEYMWFRQDGKSHVIRDPETLREARRIIGATLAPGLRSEDLADELRAMENERDGRARQLELETKLQLERLKEAKARSASADDQASLKAELQILETESADQKAKYHDLRQRLKQEQEYSSADSVNRSRQHMLELRELIENAARKGLLEAEPR